MRALRLLSLVGVVVLLAACHGSAQTSSDYWYLDSNYCGWEYNSITLFSTDPSPSTMQGGTQRSSNNCQNAAGGAAGHIQADVHLYKTSIGLCWAGSNGWVNNAGGSHDAQDNQFVGAYICGDGYYYPKSWHRMFNGGGYVSDPDGFQGKTDYTCYHNPCQG